MCTVTIITNGENDFVLTSNRDEAPNRISLSPNFYNINETKMLFPKDEKAGGTWIGVSEKKRLICLLNGGFEFHKREDDYRLSRGVVVKDLLSSLDVKKAIKGYNLENVEPFTLVIVDWNRNLKLYEFVWDGTQKHFCSLPKEAKIWSSSTLYSESMKKERKQWFEEFKNEYELSSANALQFHKTTHINNEDYGVIMDRGFVKTTSITQVIKTNNAISMTFENLQNKTISTTNFLFPETVNE